MKAINQTTWLQMEDMEQLPPKVACAFICSPYCKAPEPT